MFKLRSTPDFDEWMERADNQVRKRVLTRLNRAELGNLGDHKMLGAIGEMQIDFGPGYRVYFTMRKGVIVFLLCAGDKKTQPRDIERARLLAAEV